MKKLFISCSLLAVAALANAAERPATYRQVQAILTDKCVSCHGDEKDKAELRLDGLQYIMKGGKSGPVLKMGDPYSSSIYTLSSLPPDHDDHMPSKGDSLTQDELAIMWSWISARPVSARANDPEAARAARAAQRASSGGGRKSAAPTLEDDPRAKDLPEVQESVLASLNSKGVIIDTYSSNKRILGLTVSISDSRMLADSLKEIASIAPNILKINFSRSAITDADLAFLSSLSLVEHIDLANTSVTDAGMAHIAKASGLRWLNLSRTQITNKGVNALHGLSNLEAVYLWGSAAKPAAGEALTAAVPNCVVTFE